MFPRRASTPADAPVPAAHIVPSDYGYAQVILPPERHRDRTEAEIEAARVADRIGGAELMKRFGWTEDDFGRASVYGMPTPIGQQWHVLGGRTSYWSRNQIEAWRVRVLEFAATLAG